MRKPVMFIVILVGAILGGFFYKLIKEKESKLQLENRIAKRIDSLIKYTIEHRDEFSFDKDEFSEWTYITDADIHPSCLSYGEKVFFMFRIDTIGIVKHFSLNVFHITPSFHKTEIATINIDGVNSVIAPNEQSKYDLEEDCERLSFTRIKKEILDQIKNATKLKIQLSGQNQYVIEVNNKELAAMKRTISYYEAIKSISENKINNAPK